MANSLKSWARTFSAGWTLALPRSLPWAKVALPNWKHESNTRRY
jgi:hypothetical protein